MAADGRTEGRGQRLYDRWGERDWLYRLVDRLSRPLRREAVEALDPAPGDTVVDLGCGPGRSLALLTEAVGSSGRVLGIDYSRVMSRRAGERAAESPAVSALRADARRLPLPTDGVDGVFASLSLSAVPGVEAALSEVARVLRPGCRLVVVDGRTPDGPLGRALDRLYARLVDWQAVDLLALLRERFPSVEVVRRFDAGLGVVAVARNG